VAGYRLTPTARDGLRGILAYVVDRFGAATAYLVLNRLIDAFEFLAETPGAGHRRNDITEDVRVRFWSVGPTLIAYRPDDSGGVEVLLVERGARDWRRLLDPEVRESAAYGISTSFPTVVPDSRARWASATSAKG
jgi:plasmid stabilization system protein ParE